FLGLLGELALAIAAALAHLPGHRLHPLPLGFLFLPAGELAQLFHQRVHLLVGLLLLRALRGFVLVGELVAILLGEIREGLGDGAGAPAPAAPTAALRSHLLFVLFLGFLELLQRAVLRRQRIVGRLGLELLLGRFHLGGRFRQQAGDLLERGIGLDQPA